MHRPERPDVLCTGLSEALPFYASEHAAGADLKAHLPKTLVVDPGQRVLIPTGLRLAIPPGWEGQVRPRSGLAVEKGLTLLNSPGTIDADYRGEVKVLLVNLGDKAVSINPGDRIAQLVIAAVYHARFSAVDELPETERGGGGFGSTGR